METRINTKMTQMEERINTKIDDEIRDVKIIIELDVGKRIDALFDGYKLAHEKQWELEKTVDRLIARIERLEAKAG